MNITVYLGAFPGNDPSFELPVSMAVQNPVLWA